MAAQQQALQMQQAQQLQQLQAQQLGLVRNSPTSPPSSPPGQEFLSNFADAAGMGGGTQRSVPLGGQQPGLISGLPGLPQPGQTVPNLGGLAPMQYLASGATGVANPFAPPLAGLPGMLAQHGAAGSFASSIQGSLNGSMTGSLQGATAAMPTGAPAAAAGGLGTVGGPSAQASQEPDASGAQPGQPVAVSMAQQLEAAQAQIASQQMQLQAQKEQLHEAQVCYRLLLPPIVSMDMCSPTESVSGLHGFEQRS